MRDGMRSDQIKGNWIGGKCVKDPRNIGAQIKINLMRFLLELPFPLLF
jgi:hypothetical protein